MQPAVRSHVRVPLRERLRHGGEPELRCFFCEFELLNMCVLLLVCEVLPSFAVLYTLSPAFTVPDAELGEPLVAG